MTAGLALALQAQPARGHQLALQAFAIFVFAIEKNIQPPGADKCAARALVGECAEQRAKQLGVGRYTRILQEPRRDSRIEIARASWLA